MVKTCITAICLLMSPLRLFAANAVIEMRSYEQLRQLSAEDRSLYGTGVRLALKDLEKQQERMHLRYQSPKTKSASLEFVRNLLPMAAADVEKKFCTSAGDVVEFNVVNNQCPTVACASGGDNLVQCHALFGKICVPFSDHTTLDCSLRAEPIDKLNRANWDDLKKKLNQVCLSRSNLNDCQIIQSRLTQAEILGHHSKVVRTVSTRTVIQQRRTETRTISGRKLVREKGSVEQDQVAQGQCESQGLVEEMTTSGEAYQSDLSIMTVEDAQSLMCSYGEINEHAIAQTRQKISARLDQLKNATDAEGVYYRGWMTTLRDNLNNCLLEARKIRDSHRPITAPSITTTISPNGLFTLETSPMTTTSDISWLGRTLSVRQIDLCQLKVQRTGALSVAPARTTR